MRPESLIGASSGAIYALLGKPDLVRHDRDVEVLQYPADTCALLIYLYKPEGGGEPKTSFIDARDKQAGPASPQACLAEALNQRSAQR